ncbi:hypothetical protein [Falsiroseomonas sp. CW058]|uniref:hypothetical protein n=1 Tax=Falsiroseomonas sp. CW058 TaxID=3388664 RepID=UPI003D3191CC
MTGDDDDTVRLRPGEPPPARPAAATPAGIPDGPARPRLPAPRRALPVGRVLSGLAVVLAAGGGWWAWQQGLLTLPSAARLVAPAPPLPAGPPPAAPLPPSAPPAALPAPPRLDALPPLLDESGILAHRAAEPRLLRLADNPAIFVIDFPTLDWQGAAMNRAAALIEKAGMPRDRIVQPDELAAAIARAGDTAATFYYGHNYAGSVLARFFRIAARDAVALTAEEAWLERQFRLARSLVPEGQEIAILTIAGPDHRMDPEWRATVLRHELGHGLFATRPAYAEHVRRVWRERFTEAERAAFRAFLAREDYDPSNEELMIDEAQAYLLHTPSPRFFAPVHVGMDEAGLARLRALMREGAPHLPR